VAAVVPAAKPGSPTAVKVVPGNRQVAVTWTAPLAGPVTSYRVRAWSKTTGGFILGSCSTATTACTVTGLVNGQTVYVDVVAVNTFGTSPASAPRVSATPATVPTVPRSVVASAGSQQVKVSWSAPSSNGGSVITGYQARAWSAGSGGTLLGSCLGRVTTCTISGLVKGVTVYLDVVANNAIGTGPASTPRVAARPAAAPAAVGGVTVRQTGARLTVAWAAPDDGGAPIVEYRVVAFSAPSGGSPMAACRSVGALTCTIDGLRRGAPVHVEVVAINAAGLSSPAGSRIPGSVAR